MSERPEPPSWMTGKMRRSFINGHEAVVQCVDCGDPVKVWLMKGDTLTSYEDPWKCKECRGKEKSN